VVLEPADPFVTKYRQELEQYVTAPASRGVLVLVVRSWPKTTKLARLLPDEATIECKAPRNRLPGWCVSWAKKRHGKALAQPAAELLVELVGQHMGLLDQELAKLAAAVGEAKAITEPDVNRLAGRSWVADTFKIFDAIGQARTREALAILGRLFEQNKEPLEILGAFSWKLRQLAQVGRLHQQGMSLAAAMERANVLPYARRGVEQQLHHLGRRRLEKLYDWLLESDLGMKGNSQLPPRLLLERLIVRLARPRAAR
jgi:DNA polymerase III subunit delta